jgi:hypothetical protein
LVNFGWTYLSRDALAKAEAQLSGDAQGVRDEIGFLLIHQYYADRLFPGTSVLHTRLRYALFVPWMFLELQRRSVSGSAEQALQQMEQRICERLMRVPDQLGVIGRRSRGKIMGQPPSMVYWNALMVWGIVRNPFGRVPNRRRMTRLAWENGRRSSSRDGELLGETELLPIDTLPAIPESFHDNSALSFVLTTQEKTYLRAKLGGLRSGSGAEISLLSSLVGEIGRCGQVAASFLQSENCWDAHILSLAGEERECLVRAGHAAAMTAIGRGVYAALVEQMRKADGLPTTDLHRKALQDAVAAHRAEALKLDIGRLGAEAGVPAATLEVLRRTNQWLQAGAGRVDDLLVVYRNAEYGRKQERARLRATPNGRRRRGEWNVEKNVDGNGEERAETTPLHYRWGIVRQLLSDLHGAEQGAGQNG